MAHRKLDMGLAWTQATGLIGANRDTISAIAGLFLFLPPLAVALFVPELSGAGASAPPDADPQLALRAMLDELTAAYIANWPLMVASTLAQFVGSLSLLALLSEHRRPTVREALGIGLASLLPYAAALLLGAMAASLLVMAPMALAVQLGSALAALLLGVLALLMMPVAFYLLIKFTLVGPAIAIDGLRNPIRAMQHSWRLTKGNSLRIAVFQIMLMVIFAIVGGLVTGILGLLFALMGAQLAAIGDALVGALFNAGVTVLFLAVFAAIHRQLTGPSPEGLAQTFE